VDVPEVRYVKSGGTHIAYQVTGSGPMDLVFVPGYVTHLELQWGLPEFATFLGSLSSFSRLIRFDKRGTGMSDPVVGAPSLETRMDDVRAVLDAVGSRRAALYGLSEGAAMAILFAATYPERTAALVLRSAFPRRMWAADYPWGTTEAGYEREVEQALRIFGPRDQALAAVHTLGSFDEHEAESFLDFLRFSASPGTLEALHRMNREIDVRAVLPAVRVPTLVLHGSQDTVVPVEVAEYVTSRIPGARRVELPHVGHLALQGGGTISAEIERFLTDVWEGGLWDPEPEQERILTTVMFTDIVGSTAKAVELGDRAWAGLLQTHRGQIRRELVRFRGREIDTAGDGFFACFDGPARAVQCATAIVQAVRGSGVDVRAGLHTGECEVIDGRVGGVAVHIGSRVADAAGPGEVLVSSTVKDLVAGSGIRFNDRGATELRGIPGEWRLYAVDPPS
jgi:pimeloyl-ACP methyl ester carboxylesterase